MLAVCYGAGVGSTALLVAVKLADLRPDIITFADLLSEKPETMAHLDRMQSILAQWGWPAITICGNRTLPGTGYDDLYGNCIANETLPSLAFGMRSRSSGLGIECVSFDCSEGRADRRANPQSWRWSARASRRAATLIGQSRQFCGGHLRPKLIGADHAVQTELHLSA